MDLSKTIKAKALDLGLDAIGIAPATVPDEQVQGLKAWTDLNSIECLSFIGRSLQTRLDPGRLLPSARSVIVAGLAFKPSGPPKRPTGLKAGRVAIYALWHDYHQVLRNALGQLARFIGQVAGRSVRFKVAVDSSPVMERTMAVQAGLGFVCCNHMVAHPSLGPAIFLGQIITDLELEPDSPIISTCLGCGQCIRACPTGAIRSDGIFDATRCINTWTIEHKGPIAPDLAMYIGDRLYGCDDCLTICPLYQKAPPSTGRLLLHTLERRWIDLHWVLGMTDEQFHKAFAGSVIHRIGPDRLVRNARICLDNLAALDQA